MRVISGTSEIHRDTFEKALRNGSEDSHDVALLVGMSPASKSQVNELRKNGTKVIGYWIGTDSLCAIQDAEYRGNIPECDAHIAVHERIQAELKRWNVESTVVYPCARNESPGLPLTEDVKVGVYMPHKGELYKFEDTCDVARENPELSFVFFGGSESYNGSLPPNVKDAGRMSPEEAGELTNSFSVLLRLCQHDGFPIGGIEAKMRNRHVIENYPYPGFLHAKTLEDVNAFLTDSNVHRGDDGPWPSWYREKCSKQAFKAQIEALVKGLYDQ